MALDLSDIAGDLDLGESVTVLRTTGGFVLGGWKANPPQRIEMWGVLTPASGEALQQVPEGDRVTGALQFIVPTPLNRTSEEMGQVSDKIELPVTSAWPAGIYRIIDCTPWQSNGYWLAVLSRISGQ